jgi:tRNA(adenine34) deaminase
MFYKDIEKGFQFAFSSAINAYRRGSTAIGCAIMDANNECISLGENSIYANDKNEEINRHNLAHAEINAILKVESGHYAAENTLYTTMEPCIMCFGAMVMCYYKKVKFAAVDPYAGATHLNAEKNYNLQIDGPFEPLQKLQVALAIYRGLKLKLPHVKRTMQMYQGICDPGIQLGNKLYYDNEFDEMINNPVNRASDEDLINYMFSNFK